ncbi:hypothetical protein TNCV_701401 [Trichonephila clavipes]|nr:hypothetical protein TNCV_701401 [Trichonephila clavipes]
MAFSIRNVRLHPPPAARRSSDMRQARHLPQRWYWSIVVQVRDVIRQFTQGTPNCNTNPKATVFGIPKEPVLESAELITSRLTGAGSLLPPVYGEAWAKGHATGTPDSTFPRGARGKHVRAVRLLYRQEVVNTPQSIFDETCTDTEYKDMYVEHVQGQVADMAEWRREQLDKTKKKRPAEEDAREAKKVATED